MSDGPDEDDAIGAAGVPEAARARLGAGGAFTSTLGVAEALVLREAGLQPIAQVMGSSIFKMGWQQLPFATAAPFGVSTRGRWSQASGPETGTAGVFSSGRQGGTYELANQTGAYNDARQLAIGRLREEALAAGAEAVVGVRVRRGRRDWTTDLVEFVATGTAVRSVRFQLADDGEPLLCNLSGQDVAKLVSHGFWPVGIVGGSTIACVIPSARQTFNVGGFFTANQELPDYSRGLYDARAMAMARVERDAHALHAHGVVGVDFQRREHTIDNGGLRNLIIEMHVLGTAIVEVAHDAPPPPKNIALPLT